ncbi:unnamed protein product [Zymoseptoria tritici ST99CH_3D1]|uniref:RING-type domain-containing protein n=3 Tax=Zymoseptoria tritici TaxID=1047171 RepID=F9XJB8_ZYMTI|nr:uncharacterized protein MYCGRDRAFT_95819 [Zymoseptoria tritici IPO323]EGP84633.1 hypothetical protein MYCGRDRAFT_95819 [Zymoseptoria tritici IPO323]SMQ54180.1 unnamed protein product [Zymoseptoria tritici ST99CH_3D7]SMR58615.1 unnamed protein product [Zymoseptoria tritici ST99CH_1E4]SMR61610.1 unnamed protein product [Zymoseptoria tritici ST99CH_3D1]
MADVLAKECSNCGHWKPLNDFPANPNPDCTHSKNACSSCWNTHLKEEIPQIYSRRPLRCILCKEKLEERHVRTIASTELLDLYIHNINIKAIRSIPGYQECPLSSCRYGYIQVPDADDKRSDQTFCCQKCKKNYCLDCRVVHEGQTCKDVQGIRRAANAEHEQRSEALMKQTTKKCPGCNARLENGYECERVTCTRCGERFWWSADEFEADKEAREAMVLEQLALDVDEILFIQAADDASEVWYV